MLSFQQQRQQQKMGQSEEETFQKILFSFS